MEVTERSNTLGKFERWRGYLRDVMSYEKSLF
jgi:hypothetical protein